MKTFNKYFLLFFSLFLVCSINIFLNGESETTESFYLDPQSGTTGAVKGVVKSAENGELIENAKIILVYSKNKTVRYELQTDKNGSYYRGGLRPGHYNFTIKKEDFLTIQKMVSVRLGETIKEDFVLQSAESQVPSSIQSARKALKFFQDGKWEDAVKEFSNGIEKSKSNENKSTHILYYYRGAAQENLDNLKEALSDYQKAIKLNPDFAPPYSKAGKIFSRRNDYEKAREFYKKAVELNDQDVTTLYNYAVVLINIREQSEAITILEKLISLDKDYADAYYRLGMLYISQGKTERAKEHLQKFIDLDPENKNVPIAKKVLESMK